MGGRDVCPVDVNVSGIKWPFTKEKKDAAATDIRRESGRGLK